MKKKTLRILTVIFIISVMLVAFSTVVRASGGSGKALDPEGVISGIEDHTGEGGTEESAKLGGLIVGVVQTVGTIVAVVVVAILGIKYMTGSTEEKAEYKKTMLPYFVGAIVLFLGVTIVRVIYSFATRVNEGVNGTK